MPPQICKASMTGETSCGGNLPLAFVSVRNPKFTAWLCFRMPAILDGDEEVRKWLNYGEVKSLDALKLLRSKNILTCHPVSTLVSNSRNNSPKCIQPLNLNNKKVSDLLWYFDHCDWENVLNIYLLIHLTTDP